jgi:general secretion pathway protein J
MKAHRLRATQGSRASGFTLIEVIVAISLLAFGLALSLGTLRGASKATERAEITSQRDERLRAVQGLLRAQLGGALPIAYAFDSESGAATFLSMSADKLEFVATMPGYMSRGGPYLQTLELVPGSNGRRLLFQHRLLTTDGPIEAERDPVVLLEGIAEGGFEVQSLDEQSRPGEWLPEWAVSAQLPPMIRLKLRFVDQSMRWPDLVVATRLGAAAIPDEPVPLAEEGAVTQ